MAFAFGMLVYLAASAGLSLGLLAFIWLADWYEREPPWMVLLAMLWGAVPAILLSCVAEMAFNVPLSRAFGQEPAQVIGTVLLAPVLEEVAKGLALLFVILLFRHEFDDVLDGMVYGAAVGLGFSFVEDFIYFFGATAHGGLAEGGLTFLMRNLGFILNHSLFTALTGIGFGVARVYHKSLLARLGWPLVGLGAAIALHSLHNALALLSLPGFFAALLLHWGAGITLLVLIPFLWAAEKRWIISGLKAEINEGRIPAEVLRALPFAGSLGGKLLLSAGERKALCSDLVELAFHRRSADEAWDESVGAELQTLRRRIAGRVGPPL